MDQKEHKHEFHQSPGLCNKLYNLMKFLPTLLLKLLTSGQFTPRCVVDAPGLNATGIESSSKTNADQVVLSIAEENPPKGENMEDKANSHFPISTSDNEQDASQVPEDNDIDAKTQDLGEEAPLNKAPKKMVSINENVETIKISKKKSKKLEPQEVDQQIPLKSILKVPSDASNSQEPKQFLCSANGA